MIGAYQYTSVCIFLCLSFVSVVIETWSVIGFRGGISRGMKLHVQTPRRLKLDQSKSVVADRIPLRGMY